MLSLMEILEPRDDYPRISVDSLNDWYRLKDSLDNAAMTILDAKLTERGMVNYRDSFLLHMKQFISETVDTAVPNIRVNGQNLEEYSGMHDETEQFDEALDRRVWSLSDQRRRWDLEIAMKRRATPQEVEKSMKDLIVHQNEVDELNFSDDESDMNVDQEFPSNTDDRDAVQDAVVILMKELNLGISKQLERSGNLKRVEEDRRYLA